ncbi:hypothetical protein [Thalassomonas sp. RHCl1]|uniref:hypothetical protein n=1 Tax=Thalassomonas sp. RHCl1 TaxID=2995320 RepID=UPI00248ACA7E|nr:hypothetical protein [Thalassomonas sp. RHCl1]
MATSSQAHSTADTVLPADYFSPVLKEDAPLYSRLRNLFNQAQSGFRVLFETPESQADPRLMQANNQAWQAFNQACEQELTVYNGDITLCCWLNMASIFLPAGFDGFEQSLEKIHQVLVKGLAYLETISLEEISPEQPDNEEFDSPPGDKTAATSKVEQVFEHYQNTLLQWLGENRDSGLLTRFLPYLPLCGEKRYFHYLNARQYGHLKQFQQDIEGEQSENSARLLTQQLAKINASITLLTAIEHTLKQLSQHPHMPATTGGKVCFSKLDIKFLISPLQQLAEAICSLSKGQLKLSEHLLSATPTSNHQAIENTTTTAFSPQVNNPLQPPEEAQAALALVDKLPATASQGTPPLKEAQQAAAVLFKPEDLTREQAFVYLQQLADFFTRTEPHSPVSFQLERAIHWGHTSLAEVMAELLGDNEEAYSRCELLVGLKNLSPPEDD